MTCLDFKRSPGGNDAGEQACPRGVFGMTSPEPRITTERLLFRPLSADDVDELVRLDAAPEVRRYVDQPTAPTRAEVEHQLPRRLARYGPTGEPAFWAAELEEGGSLIGWFHLRPVVDDPTWLDLGYRLRREFWGEGYATEGAAALLRRAFVQLGADRVVAHALEANTASRRVLEKVGLQPRERYLHRDELPAVSYALDRTDYPGHPA